MAIAVAFLHVTFPAVLACEVLLAQVDLHVVFEVVDFLEGFGA